jgi:hypothetical protein
VVQGVKEANFIDKAAFETLKRQGDQAVRNWINKQLDATSVTVVLIGTETLNRPFVQYEIRQSLGRGNGVIGVHINGIRDMNRGLAPKGNPHTVIGYYDNNTPAYFDNIADGIYDYTASNGYANLGNWIEASARKHGK